MVFDVLKSITQNRILKTQQKTASVSLFLKKLEGITG